MHDNALAALINKTQDQLDEAARTLSELTHQRREAQGQLDTLGTYLEDYVRRLQATTQAGISTSNYHNFRRFIATLDEAISQQNKIIAQIDTHLDAGQRRWRDERRRLKAFEALKTRQTNRLRHLEQKQEQRASDEAAAGLFQRMRQAY